MTILFERVIAIITINYSFSNIKNDTNNYCLIASSYTYPEEIKIIYYVYSISCQTGIDLYASSFI